MGVINNIINKSIVSSQNVNSVSAVTFTNLPQNANTLLLCFSKVSNSVGSVNPLLRFSTNGGASYISTGYQGGITGAQSNSNSMFNQNNTTGFVLAAFSSATNGSLNGFQYIYNFNSPTNFPLGNGIGTEYDPGGATGTFSGFCTNSLPGTTNVNAFSVQFASGTISGSFQVFLIV